MMMLFALLLPPAPVEPKPVLKRVEVGKNVFLEIEGKERRAVVKAVVVLRKGPLEGLLTRKTTKEHEYILAGEFDARILHTALETAGAKAGSPVEFVPRYKPAHGSTIRVSLRYAKGGKTVTVPASEWIHHNKTKKKLDSDWVFGGSRMIPNPEGKGPPYYIANHGDVVCLCNMDSAMMDLASASPKALMDRIYDASTDDIPEKGTAVEVVFSVVKK